MSSRPPFATLLIGLSLWMLPTFGPLWAIPCENLLAHVGALEMPAPGVSILQRTSRKNRAEMIVSLKEMLADREKHKTDLLLSSLYPESVKLLRLLGGSEGEIVQLLKQSLLYFLREVESLEQVRAAEAKAAQKKPKLDDFDDLLEFKSQRELRAQEAERLHRSEIALTRDAQELIRVNRLEELKDNTSQIYYQPPITGEERTDLSRSFEIGLRLAIEIRDEGLFREFLTKLLQYRDFGAAATAAAFVNHDPLLYKIGLMTLAHALVTPLEVIEGEEDSLNLAILALTSVQGATKFVDKSAEILGQIYRFLHSSSQLCREQSPAYRRAVAQALMVSIEWPLSSVRAFEHSEAGCYYYDFGWNYFLPKVQLQEESGFSGTLPDAALIQPELRKKMEDDLVQRLRSPDVDLDSSDIPPNLSSRINRMRAQRFLHSGFPVKAYRLQLYAALMDEFTESPAP